MMHNLDYILQAHLILNTIRWKYENKLNSLRFLVQKFFKFFKNTIFVFCVKPYVPREPRKDPSNRRLNEHGIYIRHCQESNSHPVPPKREPIPLDYSAWIWNIDRKRASREHQAKPKFNKLHYYIPIVGIVVTISPSLSLYRIVVFPAASNPTIKILISFLPKRPRKSPSNMFPISIQDELVEKT